MQVFCWSSDEAHEEMRSACFDYLGLGGIYSTGPIALLGGLNPKPSVLVVHFFMVRCNMRSALCCAAARFDKCSRASQHGAINDVGQA